ncbi:PH domain-containing protein [Terribacillus saccharophilus]|uniref:PH domain-containing protein n=1 Tax=Terribacillus saccharophilus TaxID=361277 RepID=UPI003982BF8A
MLFRSKVDTYFVYFLMIIVLILWLATSWPLFFFHDIKLYEFLQLISIFLLGTGFTLWSAYSIEYIFNQDHLMVKCGPFKSRIPYANMTRVTLTKDIFTGYRVLSSRNAIEIHYKISFWGSVKISPECNDSFLSELETRCEHIEIQT